MTASEKDGREGKKQKIKTHTHTSELVRKK